MKRILITILSISLTIPFCIEAKEHQKPNQHQHQKPNHNKPHGHGHHNEKPYDNYATNNNTHGEAVAIILVVTSVTATSYTLYKLLTDKETKKNKILLAKAKEEAALFIATEGKHKGVYLERVLCKLRDQEKNISDITLATAILAYNDND